MTYNEQYQQASTQEKKFFSDTNLSMKTGNLVRDAELVGDGRYIKICIATNKQYLSENGEVQTTTNYFNILVSNKLEKAYAAAKDLCKGDWIFIRGEDGTQLFDDAKGYKQNSSTIFAFEVELRKKATSKSNGRQAENNTNANTATIN